MTHPAPSGDEIVIYGQVGNMMSVCAPSTLGLKQVEHRVNEKMRPKVGMYRVVDIATVRPGPSSPDPCNEYPQRRHWFLINRRLGVWMGYLKDR